MFTPDGYIDHQSLTHSIPYGKCTSDENGCGWIAVHNVIRHLEGPPSSPTDDWRSPAQIARAMQRHIILRGYLGTYLHGVILFLKKHGYDVKWSLRKSQHESIALQADASIFLYVGPSWLNLFNPNLAEGHYITLLPLETPHFRTLNFCNAPVALPELLHNFRSHPLTAMIGVSKKS